MRNSYTFSTRYYSTSFHIGTKLNLTPLLPTSFHDFPSIERLTEMQLAQTVVKKSPTLVDIYKKLNSIKFNSFTYDESLNSIVKSISTNSISTEYYQLYNGRSPIQNGTIYFGTHRRGGVLGDIIVDLNSKEFDASKKKLADLIAMNLSIEKIVSEFTPFFELMILNHENYARLTNVQRLSKIAGVVPLSAILFLGYGDCRPNSIAVCSLLNHFGIKSEYANFKLAIQSTGNHKWIPPFIEDHSTVIYTNENGEKYIADSYLNPLTNSSLKTLMKGFEARNGLTYTFLKEHPHPETFVIKSEKSQSFFSSHIKTLKLESRISTIDDSHFDYRK